MTDHARENESSVLRPGETAEEIAATLVADMRSIGLAAGQCSVEGLSDLTSDMAAAEAERAFHWADQVEAIAAALTHERTLRQQIAQERDEWREWASVELDLYNEALTDGAMMDRLSADINAEHDRAGTAEADLARLTEELDVTKQASALWERSSENWSKAAIEHNQRAEKAETDLLRLTEEQDKATARERETLALWRDQDAALQEIWGELGIDGDPGSSADIASAVQEHWQSVQRLTVQNRELFTNKERIEAEVARLTEALRSLQHDAGRIAHSMCAAAYHHPPGWDNTAAAKILAAELDAILSRPSTASTAPEEPRHPWRSHERL